MKQTIKIFLVFALVTTLFTSCKDDDGYSLDKYWISYGTISGDGYRYNIQLDNGSVLYIAANLIPYYKAVDGQRVMANYTILGDMTNGGNNYAVRLNNVYEILTKKPLLKSNIDEAEIGNAPINIVDEAWFSCGRYLNIKFDFKYKPYSTKKHFINLVCDDTTPTPFAPDSEGFVNLTLRHNDYGEGQNAWARGIVSFDITELVPDGADEMKVKLHWTEYDGSQKSDTGIFKPAPPKPTPVMKISSRSSSVPEFTEVN